MKTYLIAAAIAAFGSALATNADAAPELSPTGRADAISGLMLASSIAFVAQSICYDGEVNYKSIFEDIQVASKALEMTPAEEARAETDSAITDAKVEAEAGKASEADRDGTAIDLWCSSAFQALGKANLLDEENSAVIARAAGAAREAEAKKATIGKCLAAIDIAHIHGNVWQAPFSVDECAKIAGKAIDDGLALMNQDDKGNVLKEGLGE